MSNINDISILQTIIYADIFEYPLTVSQIRRFCIGQPLHEKDIKRRLSRIPIIHERNGYYFLSGRQKIILTRTLRMQESRQKIKKAVLVAKIFSLIPTIQMVGLSGSVALHNAKKDDDIDFFIIARKNSVWVTRLLTNALIYLLGIKRQPNTRYAKDKICLNMFVSRACLSIPRSRQNLFVAHEVAQVVPLVNKNLTYQLFLQKNQWVKKYLPNAFEEMKGSSRGYTAFPLETVFPYILFPIEAVCYAIQQIYMKRHKNKVSITTWDRAEFFPFIQKNPILEIFQLRLSYSMAEWTKAREKREKLASKNAN